MLNALSVRNIVLIDQLDLAFDAGMTVLTGETGAGKSILLDALTLALGGRGDASLVRSGQESGQVVAVLQLAADHPARAALRDNAIPDDEDVILRRVQFAELAENNSLRAQVADFAMDRSSFVDARASLLWTTLFDVQATQIAEE